MKPLLTLVCTLVISSPAWSCGDHVDLSVPHIHDHDALIAAAEQSDKSAPKNIDINAIFGGQLALPHSGEHEHEHEHEHESQQNDASAPRD